MPISPPTSLPTSPFDAPSPLRRHTPLPRWLREPLLHFILLGGLLFLIDHIIVGRTDDPRTIVVGPEVDSEAVEVFEETRGRKPNADELNALHRVWLDNEVLYREGLALQVDKGDTAIRERVIFKTLSVIDANVKLPPIDDRQLREWFEKHRANYDEPARYTFEEAVLAGDSAEVANSEPAVRAFVDAMNAGTLNSGNSNNGSGVTPLDTQAGLRVFKDRPHANLVQSYGADFPQALTASPPGEWRALQGRDGWHAMRLDTVTAAKPAVFEVLRGVVLQDWTDAVAAEQRTAAVRALAKKYKIIFPEHTGHGE